MNQPWSDYDSDWFIGLNSSATDIVVIILARKKQMTTNQPLITATGDSAVTIFTRSVWLAITSSMSL